MEISIITINYNNAIGLQATIDSVVCQTYNNIQYIVIDGNSDDGSKAVIESRKDNIQYWVTEPDNGIYNAMNKGIRVATGDYLLFLNSGDILKDQEVVSDVVEMGLSKDLVYGNLIYETNYREWCPPNLLTFDFFYKYSLPHPSTFIRKSLFEKVGFYNESYNIVSDWEFFILATCKYNCTYTYINKAISVFMEDGISSNPTNMDRILKERAKVLEMHFPYFLPDYKKYNLLEQEMKKINYFVKTRRFLKSLFR